MPNFGESMSHSQARTTSRKRTLQRCNMDEGRDDIVLIDVDSENFPNVIIIDIPESIEKKLRVSGVHGANKKFPLEGIISIDGNSDDECDEIGGEADNVYDDASPSSKSFPSSCHFENIIDSFGDDCQFLHSGKTPVNLSKCKRTYSTKLPSQNYYDPNIGAEGSSSESDYSDCEVTYREQWENASLKKKLASHNAQSGSKDPDYASSSDMASHPTVENKDSSDQVPGGTTTSGAGNLDYEEENLAAYVEASFCDLNGDFLHPSVQCPEDIYYKSMEEREFSYEDGYVPDISETCAKDASPNCSEWQTCENGCDGATFLHEEGYIFEQPYTSPSQEKEHMETSQNGCNFVNTYPGGSACHNHGKGRVQDEDGSLGRSCSVEIMADHEAILSRDKDEEFGQSNHAMNGDRVEFEGKKSVSEYPSFCNNNCDSSQVKRGGSSVMREEAPVIKSMHDDQVQDPCLDGNAAQICIINEREKMKETDEYKRAVEEEWASRQQQLQIQAQEAQRLRRLIKRRRAENMRIMDMERRQKLRVQEIRETQKKDEEKMGLKEQFRVEIRNELNKVEINCKDLASLLRCLGIHVGGGLFPSSNEVRAAYKRALLKLHPDRASRADIRQQVEAEEKFKLISRMKDKLLLTS